MTTSTIFFFAMGVFVLMVIGIFLTMKEFNRITNDPSQRKGVRQATVPSQRRAEATDTA